MSATSFKKYKIFRLGIRFLFAIVLNACNSPLVVSTSGLRSNAEVVIESFDRVSAENGDDIIVTGKNLSANLILTIDRRLSSESPLISRSRLAASDIGGEARKFV